MRPRAGAPSEGIAVGSERDTERGELRPESADMAGAAWRTRLPGETRQCIGRSDRWVCHHEHQGAQETREQIDGRTQNARAYRFRFRKDLSPSRPAPHAVPPFGGVPPLMTEMLPTRPAFSPAPAPGQTGRATLR